LAGSDSSLDACLTMRRVYSRLDHSDWITRFRSLWEWWSEAAARRLEL
jgi:hypothetical protein